MSSDARVSIVTRADIYQMIVRSEICVDLNAAPLAEPEGVRIFAERETMVAFHASKATDPFEHGIIELAPNKKLNWDGAIWTIINLGDNFLTLKGKEGQVVELLLQKVEQLLRDGQLGRVQDESQAEVHEEVKRRLAGAGPEELARANATATLVMEYLHEGREAPKDIPSRTWRRYVAAYLNAEREFGHGYIGVLWQTQLRGNHEPWNAVPRDLREKMLEHLHLHYDDVRQKGKHHCWADFKLQLEEEFQKAREGRTEEEIKSMPPPRIPSLQTYCAALDNGDPVEQTRRRRGKRAAYQKQKWYWSLTPRTPVHGDRAWEIGHIDHTQCDVRVRHEDGSDETGRPWWTTLTDAHTRGILAIYLTWDPPSYRSCMMVIRECVRRHGRLPQIIVVDHGSEFQSVYFDELLAMYCVTKKTRPAAEPRSGSTAERTFGTANSEFFHNLLGRTQGVQETRTIVKSHSPAELAVWTLIRLAERLEEFSYEIYDTLEHPALGQTPRNAFRKSEACSGTRKSRRIVYDQTFVVLTLPTTKKKTAKVLERGLVVINYITYWNEMLLDPRLRGKQVHVRYDPFNAGVAWVYANKMWIKCHSTHYAELCGKSEKLIRIITDKIRARNRRFPNLRLTVNAITIARFLRELRNEEEVLRQERYDRESQQVRDRHFKVDPPQSTQPVVDTASPKPPQSEGVPVRRAARKRKTSGGCEVYDAEF